MPGLDELRSAMLHDRPEGSYENTSTLGSVAAHRGTDELLAEAVDHLVTYNDWFAHKGEQQYTRGGARRHRSR
jgi:hypothetical protein